MTHCTLHGRDDCDICRAIGAGQSGYTLQPQVSEFGAFEAAVHGAAPIELTKFGPGGHVEAPRAEPAAIVERIYEDIVGEMKRRLAILEGEVATLKHTVRVLEERNAHIVIHGTPIAHVSQRIDDEASNLVDAGSSPAVSTAPAERVASAREGEGQPGAFQSLPGPGEVSTTRIGGAPTAFDRYVGERLADPESREAYVRARTELSGAPAEDRSDPPSGWGTAKLSDGGWHCWSEIAFRTTREEAIADAWALVDSLTRSAVERATEELRRKTLEEAARLMCRWCREGRPRTWTGVMWHELSQKHSAACAAAPIWLQLEKEGGT